MRQQGRSSACLALQTRSILLLCICLLPPIAAFAEQILPSQQSGETCEIQINMAMRREQRRFRANVYGLTPATATPVGGIRHDADGQPWYKQQQNTWISLKGKTVSNDTMDGELTDAKEGKKLFAESVPQKGLLETNGILTSDLIPFIGQGLWAFQCALDRICANARRSLSPMGGTLSVGSQYQQENLLVVTGCEPTVMPTFGWCHVADSPADQTHVSDTIRYCEEAASELLEQELQILRAVVEYDAAYRSFLQFAGNFDLFLQDFRWPLLTTLRQLLEFTDVFGTIPCFLSSCEASPIPGL